MSVLVLMLLYFLILTSNSLMRLPHNLMLLTIDIYVFLSSSVSAFCLTSLHTYVWWSHIIGMNKKEILYLFFSKHHKTTAESLMMLEMWRQSRDRRHDYRFQSQPYSWFPYENWVCFKTKELKIPFSTRILYTQNFQPSSILYMKYFLGSWISSSWNSISSS